MIAIFNDNSLPEKYDGKKSETMMNTFIETCTLSYRACKAINNKFILYVKENFRGSPFIEAWEKSKGRNSDEVKFLRIITDVHYEEFDCDIYVSIESEEKWSKPNLTIDGNSVKNMSNTKHVYDRLEYFPIWNNYPFESWKPDFNADEKLLPVAELSDYVWLKVVGKPLESYDSKRMKQPFWNDFVEILRHKPGGGVKEGFIIPIFSKISSVNGFVPSKICKKPVRKLVEFPYKFKFYLAPDKETGAFEVYNEKKVHQGEWNFFGRKNSDKSAVKTRDICN